MARLDKFLWSVRIFKTRSDAAEACKSGKVHVFEAESKPSREVKTGDLIEVRKMNVRYKYRVKEIPTNRLPAKLVPDHIEDITPEEELAKLNVPKESIFVSRDRGTGRPTKKERRDLDNLLDF
ncbi:MAG: RNA-binding S4 domain-containing protein [Bacteroidales bacterium]|jgi:ribosome-associated heat shock protein Hsp15|nr:RNA-binding S4 domain-containing protein [Bacteroidales bacterium]MDD3299508.1 RNA-binding S4 domain-containing protein [Bacteroidales bacterium]MDD3844234.1 RNA-binding S4 domain-containing protein [Bacteroidales bacterium]MDD4618662.1 RNA-binding S4 domain-containing protein [Bacteroidales bacterium]